MAKKKTIADAFSCKNIHDFISTVVQVLPYTGYSRSRFYICQVGKVRFLTKLCFYKKTEAELYGKAAKNTMSQIDAEIAILNKLRESIILTGLSPCILELVFHKVCHNVTSITPRKSECEDVIMNQPYSIQTSIERTFCYSADLVRNGLAHNKCAFMVLERCDMSLEAYLDKFIANSISTSVIRSLLFQIIYTLYVITKVYPKFRHNDLHAENVMLKFDPDYVFDVAHPKYMKFHVGSGTNHIIFNVPYYGIIVKIIDFGFSIIPEEGIISDFTSNRELLYYRADNDLLKLFNHIYHTVMQKGSGRLDGVEEILSTLEPNRTYVHHYIEYIKKIEKKIPTYDEMLRSAAFDEYKTAPVSDVINIYGEYGWALV